MFYDEYIRLCNQIRKSPSAVAEALGFQKSSVTRWKQGSIPTDNNKRRIAEYFGVPVSLFANTSPRTGQTAAQPDQPEPEATALPSPAISFETEQETPETSVETSVVEQPMKAEEKSTDDFAAAPSGESLVEQLLDEPVLAEGETSPTLPVEDAPAENTVSGQTTLTVDQTETETQPFYHVPQTAVPAYANDRAALKLALFGDVSIGDDLLDDVLSYAQFRLRLIGK